MANYSTNQFKNGLKLILDGNPCSIVNNEIVKPGKGQAFNRVKFKDLITGKTLEKTFKSGESLVGADVMELDMQYLYSDGEWWHFMDPDSFEQYALDATAISEAINYLVEQDNCVVTLWNDNPISVTPANHVILEVVDIHRPSQKRYRQNLDRFHSLVGERFHGRRIHLSIDFLSQGIYPGNSRLPPHLNYSLKI